MCVCGGGGYESCLVCKELFNVIENLVMNRWYPFHCSSTVRGGEDAVSNVRVLEQEKRCCGMCNNDSLMLVCKEGVI